VITSENKFRILFRHSVSVKRSFCPVDYETPFHKTSILDLTKLNYTPFNNIIELDKARNETTYSRKNGFIGFLTTKSVGGRVPTAMMMVHGIKPEVGVSLRRRPFA